jgi:DUF4097 and DUF4098 domain-containing protein YvlB
VLQTGSGDVDGAELTADVVDARATSGDVFLDVAQVPKRVYVVSSSGDVTISVPHTGAGYDAQVSTSSGDPDLRVNRNSRSDSTLSAITSSGDATIRYR